jgi:Ulp1 family protease
MLLPGNKLGDEIVNYFIMGLQSKASGPKYPLIRNSFFAEVMDLKNTKRLQILKDNNLVIFPVNYEDHWVLVQMEYNNKKLTVFDSILKPGIDPVLYQVCNYYRSLDKCF